MKALIISDKQEIIDFSSKFLRENGYDIIVYRWLLKAIDNIEEIQPDLIILSAAEYPRHWKTLASFVKSGIGGNNVQIYLYDPDSLSDEEKQKAVELGIKDYITSLNTKNFEKIILSNNNKTSFSQDTQNSLCRIIFTNPVTRKFLFGTAVFDEQTKFYLCSLQDFADLQPQMIIKYVSIYDQNNQISVFTAKILEIKNDDLSENTQKLIKIEPMDYYEKN